MTKPRDELVEVLPLSGFDQSLTYAVPLPFCGRLAIGSLAVSYTHLTLPTNREV